MVQVETKLTFAELLEDLLQDKKMRKAKLAKEIQVGKSTITKWCNGAAEPQLSQLRRLTEVFDIDFNQFFGVNEKTILSEEERYMISLYRKISKEERSGIQNLMELFAKEK